MPEARPFIVPRVMAESRNWVDDRERLDFETMDAFEIYRVGDDNALVWLSQDDARRLPVDLMRAQPAKHLWSSGDPIRDRARAVRYVETRRRSSQHDEVADSTWAAVGALLPGARVMAGTFPERSGPNCFGAVMGAAGIAGAVDEWMQCEPFDAWLAEHAEIGGADDEIGTVLVWRTREGESAHAAVTLGDGWLLHKPSQGWMSPTKVLSVRDGKNSARAPGIYLHRYRMSS